MVKLLLFFATEEMESRGVGRRRWDREGRRRRSRREGRECGVKEKGGGYREKVEEEKLRRSRRWGKGNGGGRGGE